ncbi:DUF4148 domain-containing protein [Burkholderia sp. Ac-20353]|uniref:DUF4148 domain-containing protein n=1 Tax=Burkholderia sp. Ac-20353 TaxID=2703894 RepID=UPI00197BA586|nr:DUF4148 domain-containing protein [Burkholderia sp. Ac-20353]MBN3786867.1 DUF4148 domain-containing protein [Burkholderia sp. Ac-20353]
MKHLTWIAFAALAVGVSHLNAAEQSVAPGASGNDATIMSQAGLPSAPQSVVTTSRVAPVGKTRAEVRQELIQAEKDGSLERLNSLVYTGR